MAGLREKKRVGLMALMRAVERADSTVVSWAG